MNRLKTITKNRKGQTSVEYLVLLAIAIVIAVVAVGVLAGFIRIGTATTYKKKSNIYWKSADIGIMDWEIFHTSQSRNSTLVIQNNKEYQIRLNWVSIDGGTTQYLINMTFLPGDAYKWESTEPFDCVSGGSYSYGVTFNFRNMEHEIDEKTFTGVEKLTGQCSN